MDMETIKSSMKADDIFNENFHQGDIIMTLLFAPDKRPKTKKEFNDIWKDYIRKVRIAYKKAGVVLKWQKGINPRKKNPHIHIALTSIDIEALPEWKYGKVHIKPVDGRDYYSFGSYARMQGENINEEDILPGTGLCCYAHSRNCVISPKVIVKSNRNRKRLLK